MVESKAVSVAIEGRIRVVVAAFSVGFLLLSFRLFQLQVIRGPEMERLAELNRTQVIPRRAARGLVMDRNGEVLLGNAPNFSLLYSAQSVSPEGHKAIEAELMKWFPGSEGLIRRKLSEARQTGKMTRVVAEVPRPVALALIEKRLTLPGVNVVVEPKRRTRYGTLASHVLGYVDEISPSELERRKDGGYRMGQLVGRMGVERVYENAVRGQDGGLQFEMDAYGRHVQVMRQIPSVPGANLVLTLDRRLQEAAERGLKASPSGRGAAVALDPRTGAVLALASAPDFDPAADLFPYLRDPALPLFNRALQGAYPPGSVFKIVTAAAGLKDANWDIRKTYSCTGVFRLGSKEFGCWSVHGQKDFMGAVAWSCNVYFYNIGLRVGPDPIERLARAFGMGAKTGIDLPSESSGLIPGRGWKREAKNTIWYEGDTVNFSIGQGFVTVTPVQAAVMIAAVANGGQVWQPYVLDRVVDSDGRVVRQQQPQARARVDLPPAIFERLRLAMEGVVTTGTGRGIQRPDLVSGAKSGTAQNPHGKDHAWFAAYSGRPGEPPSLAVAVCIENGGRGSAAAGPVAREMITAAFPPPPREAAPRIVPVTPLPQAAPPPVPL